MRTFTVLFLIIAMPAVISYEPAYTPPPNEFLFVSLFLVGLILAIAQDIKELMK
jgi:hypothetical protein